ncbi:glycosyltransferase family 2 protein [Gloeocapsa sp. PCC 73106]|uniref:glycosyltransferase family 2 protein n=1 Tax=Gloeocapsa sp. PCC 73106 TaxID=102232 RepID=UPI0002FBA0A4|nr:glycosyltransferase [Gloeocapsa sp. PCC 73106]
MTTAELSIVLGTYNRLELLKQAIDSILRETSISYKIYITDAGSTDGTICYLQSIASDTIIPILVGKKLGQAKAYNEVFQQINTPYVCWLSDDNVIVNQSLDLAVKILQENPNLGMIALKTKDQQGPFTDAPYIGGVSSIGILNVNQGVLRTEVLKQVGGFSEEFRDYGIDPDLTTKVLLLGYDIAYTKIIAIQHHRNWGPGEDSPEYQQMMEKQVKYKQLYLETYGRYCQPSWFWQAKKLAWFLIRRGLGVQRHLNSDQPLLFQLIPRDWHNIMTSRYISILDPLRSKNKNYYLIQHCPPHLRAKSLKLTLLASMTPNLPS